MKNKPIKKRLNYLLWKYDFHKIYLLLFCKFFSHLWNFIWNLAYSHSQHKINIIKFNNAEAGTIVLKVNNSSSMQHNIQANFGVVFLSLKKKTKHVVLFSSFFFCLSLKKIPSSAASMFTEKFPLKCYGEEALLKQGIKKNPNNNPKSSKRTRKILNTKFTNFDKELKPKQFKESLQKLGRGKSLYNSLAVDFPFP